MKNKSVIILAVALAALVAIIVVKKRGEKPVSIVEQAQLARLLPEGLSKGDVAKLEIYAGDKSDKKVTLSREGDAWTLTSLYGAPGDGKIIDEYLDKLTGLQGEPRSSNASDADLEAYALTDAKAFHVVGYKTGATEAAFHVLVGKSPTFQQTFVRAESSKDVFVSDVNFREEAGVTAPQTMPDMPNAPAPKAAPEASDAPPAAHWLNKEILKVAKDEITGIALTTPDKKLTFALQEKPKPAEAASSAEGSAGAESTAGPEGSAAKQESQFEWKLVEGGPASGKDSLKEAGVENLARVFTALNATDVADPAKKPEYGLTPPAFTCALTVKGQEKPVVIEAGRPDVKGDAYLRVADGKADVVYRVASSTFDRIFPRANLFFELPSIDAPDAVVDRVEYVQPEGNVVALHKGKAWAISEPSAPGVPVQAATLDAILRTLTSWHATDYAYDGAATGLDAPTRSVTFTGPGMQHVIAIGKPSATFDGYYAKLDDQPQALAMSRTDYDAIFVEPKQLFELGLLNLAESDVNSVTLTRGTDSAMVVKNDRNWDLLLNGKHEEADQEAVEALVGRLCALQASDVEFGKGAIEGAPDATIVVSMQEGAPRKLTFGPRGEKGQAVQVDDKPTRLSLSPADAVAVLPPVESLKKKPEPAAGAAVPMTTAASMEMAQPAAPVEATAPAAASAARELPPAPLLSGVPTSPAPSAAAAPATIPPAQIAPEKKAAPAGS